MPQSVTKGIPALSMALRQCRRIEAITVEGFAGVWDEFFPFYPDVFSYTPQLRKLNLVSFFPYGENYGPRDVNFYASDVISGLKMYLADTIEELSIIDSFMPADDMNEFAATVNYIFNALPFLKNLKALRLDRIGGFEGELIEAESTLKEREPIRAFYDAEEKPRCLSKSLQIFDSCLFFDAHLIPVAFPNVTAATIPAETFECKYVLDTNPFRFASPAAFLTRVSIPLTMTSVLDSVGAWSLFLSHAVSRCVMLWLSVSCCSACCGVLQIGK